MVEREKVLIVEDDAFIAQMHGLALGTVFDIEIVGLREETIQRLRRRQQERVDLILLDLMLPNGDGWNVLRPVYLEAPEVPIVVVTGFDVEIDARTAACVMSYLRKPVSIEQLRDAVVHAMAKKRICNRAIPVDQQLERVKQMIDAEPVGVKIQERQS